MTTIIALLVLVSAIGMEIVNADCQIDSDLINRCCCLGYKSSGKPLSKIQTTI